MKSITNPKRAILAAILEGDAEPLKQYRNRLESCIYVFNAFSKDPVAYCIYPDLTVEVTPMTSEAVFQMMGPPTGEGFDFAYDDLDSEVLKEDLQKHPEKYYQKATRHYYA